MGETMRKQSEAVVEQLWMNSVSTYPVCVHDVNGGLPPEYHSVDDYAEILYAHFEAKSSYTAGGNEPTYYLTFRPDDMRTYPSIKVGSYVNIPDVHGNCEYWLIVHCDNDNELQKLQILKCNYIIKWISNNIIYSCLGVLRGTSDENGVETVGQISTVDSDIFFWMPTNSETQIISYDTRFLISSEGRFPPLAWKVSRIRDVGPIGLTRLSLAQDLYNSEHDNAEFMIADYYNREITPTPSEEITPIPAEEILVTYNGTKAMVRVGSQKIFTANLAEDNISNVKWHVSDGNNTYDSEYENTTYNYGDYTMITTNRTLCLKVAQNYDLVKTVLTITAECEDGSIGKTIVEVVS
jgi:hypothetical protein